MKLLPPHLVLILTIASILVGLIVPVLGPLPLGLRIAGGGLAAASIWINVSNAQRFAKVGTNIETFNDPGVFVTDGAFRFSRNPMYLGFFGIMVAVALMVGTLTAWIGVIGFWAAGQFWYIPFEEGRLLERFGADYVAYQDEVRRWIGRR
jgi:protein-S-isoprenylcysteine O-methyltransferase Ste14